MSDTALDTPVALSVGILALSDDTAEELIGYLVRAGVTAMRISGPRDLAEPSSRTQQLHSVVIFPDDYAAQAIEAALASLARATPDLLQIIVTRQPLRFLSTRSDPTSAINRFVLPRPTFGWLILDTVRSNQQTTKPPS